MVNKKQNGGNKKCQDTKSILTEKVVMEIFDKEKKIGYAVKIEPIDYDENGEAVNL